MYAGTICLRAAIALGVASAAHATEPFLKIVEQTSGTTVISNSIPGQSLITPAAPRGWNQLRFNFVDTGGNATATGNVFVFLQEYTGDANTLSALTPGVFGVGSADVGRAQFIFPPEFTLFPSRNYNIYADSLPSPPILQSANDPYADGVAYVARSPFTRDPGADFAFLLEGVEVPEPGSLALLGLLGAWALNRRGRHKR